MLRVALIYLIFSIIIVMIKKGYIGNILRTGVELMINFDEEIQKFQPSLEVDEAEEVINNNDLTDVTDIIKTMLKQMNQ